MSTQVKGKTVKVGDVVGFKSDIEQYGAITAINRTFRHWDKIMIKKELKDGYGTI